MTFYQNLTHALVEAGCSVTVAEGSMWRTTTASTVLDETGVPVHVLQADGFARVHAALPQLAAVPTFRRHVASSLALWRQVRDRGPFDVIEAVDFGFGALGPLLDGRTVIQQLHASVGQIGRHDPQSDQALDEALGLALDTELTREAVPQTYSRANANYWRAQTRLGVDMIRPAWRAACALRADCQPGSHVAVFGRVQRWKGPHILCEALQRLGDRAPMVDWYGRDTPSGQAGVSTDDWLKSTYPDIWRRRVRLNAPVPASRVREIQAAARLNVVPSTWDVFNFTAVEALASGRPTVCSDGAGAAELIDDGVSGFVYRATEPASLAQAIERAMSLSPAGVRAMAEAARATLERELEPATIARARVAAYAAAVSRGRARSVPDWVEALVGSEGRDGGSGLGFLGNVPLADLLPYVGRRVARRFRGSGP